MTMTTIDLPQVGESVTEGTIQKWLKKPGDRISKYDPLVEVETDKVTMEVPSPVNGVMGAIIAAEGSTIPMGAPICEMETDEAVPSAAPAAPEPAQAPAQPAAASPPSTVGGLIEFKGVMGPSGVLDVGGDGAPPQAVAAPAAAPAPAPAPVAAPPATDGRATAGRPRLSPVVQKLAAEHNVSLDEAARIPGTGVGGRVTKQDILKYIETRSAAPAAAPAAPAPAVAPAFDPGADEKVVPLTAVRKRIAENMTRVLEIPVAWGLTEVDVSSMVRARARLKDEFLRNEGVTLTYLPFVLQAVAQAIKENPLVNSRWGGDHVKLLRRVNIGVAVAAAQGLVVPVIHDADQYSVAGLARAIAGVVQRARDNSLRLEDVQGGTFTLNNTGVLGTVSSQPIINHPQVAILTTEAIVKRPVVVGDAIAIRSMMNICLSFDHRVMDGNDSVSFMQSVKRRLEAIGDDVVVY